MQLLESYTTVCPIDSIHTGICILRICAIEAKRLHIFVQWNFVQEKFKCCQAHASICYCKSAYERVTRVRVCKLK